MIPYRRLGTTCLSHHQGSVNTRRAASWPFNMVSLGCPETSVRDYHCLLRNIAEDCISQVYGCCLSVVSRKSYMAALVWLIYLVWKRHWNMNIGFTENLWTNWQTPLNGDFIEKYAVHRLIKEFPHFMERKGSMPYSQPPTTCPFLSQTNAVCSTTSHFPRSILILSCHLRQGIPSGPFHSCFSTPYAVLFRCVACSPPPIPPKFANSIIS